jgi:ferrochelatase
MAKQGNKGVLIINLGSPKSPTAKDVKPYLAEFLMDKRVIDLPKLLRTFLVKGIILNTRPKKSAAAYQKIWWEEGSPLIVISERFTEKLKKEIDLPVALGMRYGEMSIQKALKELQDKGVEEVYVIPMYPQYAMSSYETVEVKTREVQEEFFSSMKLYFQKAFYKEPDYIEVLANDIKEKIKGKDYDHILISYHGVPERHIKKGDVTKSHCKIDGHCCVTDSKAHDFCYRHQCITTTNLLRKALGESEENLTHSFQSRLGSDAWIKPYTDQEFERLAQSGKKKLLVITPAFVADCLETLEEIAMEGKAQFLEAGGSSFEHISCLNDSDHWVATVANWIKNWNEDSPSID